MNLKTIVLLTGLGMAAPIVAPVAQNTVMAQDARSEQYQKGRGLYLDGIVLMGTGRIQENGQIERYSRSAQAFNRAENIFGALADIDPNYANGKALELQILSSLAYDGDIDFVASRPDKDKILPFLLKVANNEYDVNYNYLDKRNLEVKKMLKRDVRYGSFYAEKQAGLLQAIHMINPSSLDKVKNLTPQLVYNTFTEYTEDNNEKKGLELMNNYINKWDKDKFLIVRLAEYSYNKRDYEAAIKYYTDAKNRTQDTHDKKIYQDWIEYIKNK